MLCCVRYCHVMLCSVRYCHVLLSCSVRYCHVLLSCSVRYCCKNYDAEKEKNKDVSLVPSLASSFHPLLPLPSSPSLLIQVYLSLLKMYMSPPDLEKEYGICLPNGSPRPTPNLKLAIQVLTTHHCKIDTIKVGGASWLLWCTCH